MPAAARTPTDPGIRAIFEPRSIAVIGASPNETSVGSRPVRYLKAAGFPGGILQVNPSHRGRAGYVGDICEVPKGSVDLALIMLGRDRALTALQACAAHGVRAAIIGAAGFSEVGTEGRELQRQIAELARRTGIRVVGPNSLGVLNVPAGNYATFASLADIAPRAGSQGKVAVVSQSGAIASYLVAALDAVAVPCATWLSTGNEADVEVADALFYLAGRDDIAYVVVYLEGARDGLKLFDALLSVRRAGMIVGVLKAGRSAIGSTAVASHTAAIAGADSVYDAIFRQSGSLRFTDFSELIAAAQLAGIDRKPAAEGLCVLTVSGGVGALVADEAAACGIDLVPTPPVVRGLLEGRLPFASLGNPIDVTGQVANHPETFFEVTRAIQDVACYGSVLIFAGPALVDRRYGEPLVDGAIELHQQSGKRVFVSGAPAAYALAKLSAAGVPLITDPLLAVRALARVVRAGTCPLGGLGRAAASEAAASEMDEPGPRAADHAVLRSQLDAGQPVLDEAASKALLTTAGITVPRSRRVESAAEAVAFADEIGAAVVLKAVAGQITHKTEFNLVHLGLADRPAIEGALINLRASIDQHRISNAGILAEEQMAPGVELLVNARRDPLFGLVLTVGSGGIYAESEHDTVTWVGLPDDREFERGLAGLRLWPRLCGGRGRPRADIGALYALTGTVALLVSDPGEFIAEIEINPVRVTPGGDGAVALDALVFLVPRPQREDLM
jgi:acyl-CoA synthetase (NDP forming)